ncbi:MAG TPA: polyphosphate kinase 1 [Solirubrobacteraceae bacterium]|nr:polyphosphate kinase 1 [Solirubrobacteraceae bacterium]
MSDAGGATEALAAPRGAAIDLSDHALYFNRELSWLDFNARVLELAEDERLPLLERVRFCSIYTSNLDEYFMVRVAGLHDQIDAGVENPGPDGRTPSKTIAAIRARVLELSSRLARCYEQDLKPALLRQGIRITSIAELSESERAQLSEHFHRAIFPALTPLAVAPARPFPYISNLSLSLAVLLRDQASDQTIFARVKVPTENLPRFVAIGADLGPAEDAGSAESATAGASAARGEESEGALTLVALEEVIAHHLDALFPGTEILECCCFRVTRDADLEVSEDAADLLQAVEDELRRRRFGEIVRVEVGAGCSERLRSELATLLKVAESDVYSIPSLLDMRGLDQVARLPAPQLRFPPLASVTHPRLLRHEGRRPDVLGAMRDGDLLVHHPYDSFATSVERFVEQAVADPDVLAIKQTLYRTSDDSRLVPALIEAAEAGKQAVALVELQARFDERRNIRWARALEEAGVHVVYGQPQLKTHVKCVLVVRREGTGVRNYVHIGTGNYNSATARLYTDFGLFTTDEQIGADIAEMFNYLTGYGHPLRYRRILSAPEHLREGMLEEIGRTIAAARAGKRARIAMKMNALVDVPCIRALYEASQAGVRVDLNVRGICCLRPGVEGISENIRVVSIVGRLLEHSRIYLFEHGEDCTLYIASADLMPRNLDHRVEVAVPIAAPELQAQLIDTLQRGFADNTSSWELGGDGSWRRLAPAPGEPERSLQAELAANHARMAAESPPAAALMRSEPTAAELSIERRARPARAE